MFKSVILFTVILGMNHEAMRDCIYKNNFDFFLNLKQNNQLSFAPNLPEPLCAGMHRLPLIEQMVERLLLAWSRVLLQRLLARFVFY